MGYNGDVGYTRWQGYLDATMAENPVGICFVVKAECTPLGLMMVPKCRACPWVCIEGRAQNL